MNLPATIQSLLLNAVRVVQHELAPRAASGEPAVARITYYSGGRK